VVGQKLLTESGLITPVQNEIQSQSFVMAFANGGRRKKGHDVVSSNGRCCGAAMMLA